MARNGTNYDLLLQSSGAISFQGSIRNTNKVIPNYKSNVESGTLGKAKLNIDILLLIKEILHHLRCIINLVAHKSSDKHGCPTTCAAEQKLGLPGFLNHQQYHPSDQLKMRSLPQKKSRTPVAPAALLYVFFRDGRTQKQAPVKTGTCRASHLFLVGDFHI